MHNCWFKKGRFLSIQAANYLCPIHYQKFAEKQVLLGRFTRFSQVTLTVTVTYHTSITLCDADIWSIARSDSTLTLISTYSHGLNFLVSYQARETRGHASSVFHRFTEYCCY